MKFKTIIGESDNKVYNRMNKSIGVRKISYILTGVLITNSEIFAAIVESHAEFKPAIAFGISVPDNPLQSILVLSVVTVIMVRVLTKIHCASKSQKLKKMIYKKRKEIGYW